MSKDKLIEINLDLKNLGPHVDLNFSDKTSSIKMGIFANNGLGKTFISRAFRLASPLCNVKSTNHLLTTNENKGKFIFKIDHKKQSAKKLEIIFKKDSKPLIKDNTGYLFHVFNREYVSENLESADFKPDDNISGYILGKTNIDVTKEKKELNDLLQDQKRIHKKMNNAIQKAILELDDLKISKNTKEYKEVNFDKVIQNIEIKETQSFDSLKEDHQKLKAMPDGIKDINELSFHIDISLIDEVEYLLKTSFSKSNLNKQFVEDIKSKQDFIEHGINLYKFKDQHCPFCKQSLSNDAINLINKYNKYIGDSEAKTIKKMDNQIKKLDLLKEEIENHYNIFNEVYIQFNNLNNYLPSSNFELKNLSNNDSVLVKIEELKSMLIHKKMDIEFTNFDFEKQIEFVMSFLNRLEKEFSGSNTEITLLNKTKNSISIERRKLNKKICNARYMFILKEQKENIAKNKVLESKISELQLDIEEKENKSKIKKRTKVIRSLKYFLNFFFSDKYSFDENEFSITFMDQSLSNNAPHVLSDGEKGIVAFCYYLASVHTIIQKEDDYKKLFFVIDDPISSMDFNFVYKVTQSISIINQHFDPKSFDRFIILTHNLEFMNLLMSNRIIGQKYILKKNDIAIWNDQLMLPYENHLNDIIEIVNSNQKPSHTTPNSIRHVLETICHFENRNKNLAKFIFENPKLKCDSYIHSIIQDLSHGKVRYQPLPEDDLISACNVVVDFISERYPGQLYSN
ncbi:AAA family ATPase [Methanobacterium alcaliphilum]|uniref:AAA family ATPase n=1 Tax=Methanobacterium alcaliphilum TaxID=392018 RepID=UPI00200A87BD|nr:AAA family ATPase [Methanobacterium alcaliphilum]MCK9151380.1 AAA family ATPase [Methanobacterium alcaliphilum]